MGRNAIEADDLLNRMAKSLSPRLGASVASELRDPRLLDPTGAAKRLNVSKGTIYALAASGELAHFRIGRRLRFAPSQLNDFLRERECHAELSS